MLSLALTIALVLVGCKNITISGPKKVAVGGQITLTIESVDATDATWTSSDEKIATVKDGVVTGISEGDVQITVNVNGKEGKYKVKVSGDVNSGEKLFIGASIVSEKTNAYDMIELSLMEKNPGHILDTYNPFDYDAINVYGVFTSPSGKEIKMPAFWYRDYIVTLNTAMSTGKVKEGEPDGLEMVSWNGDYEYRLRFQPTEAGVWTYKVYSEIAGCAGVLETQGSIDVSPKDEDYKGLIRIDKSNNRTFMFEDGTTFMPVGENMGWWVDDSRKTYDFYVWFENASKNNMNITRIWMATWGFCLHWGSKIPRGVNASSLTATEKANYLINLTNRMNCASRLDLILQYADQFDLYFMLTLVNHGQFSAKTNAEWSSNPYNTANGGIIDRPDKFFTDSEAKRVYKNELMYIIGRYGYSDHILCWELFNEVDWTDNSSTNAIGIKSWHQEMASFIKNNDPYKHLISTSYKTETGPAFTLDIIDFVCPHSYGYSGRNICDTLPEVQDRLYNQYKKPVVQAEVGIDWENGQNNYRLDPNGIHLRQASWAGIMGGGAAGAMNWWWDSYVHPYDLYYQFAGAGAYAKKMDLRGSDYTQLRTLSGVSMSNGVGLIGYRFDNRIYGYVYDKNWFYSNTPSELNNISVSVPFNDGNYTLELYNALTGVCISTRSITVSGGNVTVDLPAFTSDIAFIVKE